MGETYKIAIDGYSGTGKSTLAKQMAKRLGFVYLDTGAMYRGVAFYALRNGCIATNGSVLEEKLISQLCDICLDFVENEQTQDTEMHLGGQNIEPYIRSMEVSDLVGYIASVKEVREAMVLQQQQIAKGKNIVIDGRDIGTVVFPDATLKLFITSPEEIRAKRRYDELVEKGEKTSYQKVLENLKCRDDIDTTRKESPLVKAKDAIVIDNSHLTVEELVNKAIGLYKNIQ